VGKRGSEAATRLFLIVFRWSIVEMQDEKIGAARGGYIAKLKEKKDAWAMSKDVSSACV